MPSPEKLRFVVQIGNTRNMQIANAISDADGDGQTWVTLYALLTFFTKKKHAV